MDRYNGGCGFCSHHFENLFYLKEQSLIWCPVFKAASTTWIKKFLKLADFHGLQASKISRDNDLSWIDTLRKFILTPIFNAQDLERVKTEDASRNCDLSIHILVRLARPASAPESIYSSTRSLDLPTAPSPSLRR